MTAMNSGLEKKTRFSHVFSKKMSHLEVNGHNDASVWYAATMKATWISNFKGLYYQ